MACIDVSSWMIFVSRHHLENMDFDEIRKVANHEISHLFEQSHNGRFHGIHQDIQVGLWEPENTSGIIMINGGERRTPLKKTKHIIDSTHCNYHLCRIEGKLHQCPYCKDFFCNDHIKPIPPALPNFNNPNKFSEWKDADNVHPCAEYYDHLIEENKKMHRKYQRSLDRMNNISKSHIEINATEEFISIDKKEIDISFIDELTTEAPESFQNHSIKNLKKKSFFSRFFYKEKH